jgi:UDP-N-acetylglucosamine--N-acetylmuramyl-(pentapeptide) pyrophosphoryl-undecaprenol N-acetylglucosamine transferase
LKVYLAAFGSGMGHASRMATLADRLIASGDDVVFSSSGEVTRWLTKKGFRCNNVPLVDVVFNKEGAFSATATLNHFPVITRHVLEQVQKEVANISRFRPDVVLSDSVASTLVASKFLGIRSAAVLNQLRLISSPNTPRTLASMLTGASVTVGSVFWNFSEDILIPDLPPPHTISERNLWNAGKASSRAQYIGFLTPRRSGPLPEDGVLAKWRAEQRRPKIFWQISGPPATRRLFLRKALESARALAEDYLFVITAGDPNGERSGSPVAGGYLYGWCEITSLFVDSCDVVISRAGHVSLSDYILRSKPSLLVPIRAQTEQMGNADKARRLGISLTADEASLDAKVTREALIELKGGSYQRRCSELRRIAEGYDALGSILQTIRRN